MHSHHLLIHRRCIIYPLVSWNLSCILLCEKTTRIKGRLSGRKIVKVFLSLRGVLEAEDYFKDVYPDYEKYQSNIGISAVMNDKKFNLVPEDLQRLDRRQKYQEDTNHSSLKEYRVHSFEVLGKMLLLLQNSSTQLYPHFVKSSNSAVTKFYLHHQEHRKRVGTSKFVNTICYSEKKFFYWGIFNSNGAVSQF
jgi:hypothetical protein